MIALLRTVVFGMAVLGAIASIAQPVPDSITLLNEVVIERQRIEDLALGHFSLKVDSTTSAQALPGSVADLLRKFGYGHIRSYGAGGLATLSLRGTGAGHSSVLWNGLPLQSPLNGQLDLSQIPVFFIDDAELQMGGSASINGSGAIGGTLHLNGRARFNEGWTFNGSASAASFNTWFGGIGQKWSGKRFSTDTRLFFTDSKNDFPFTNYNLAPPRDETREHASYRQAGLLHQDYWQPAANWLLQVKLWAQDNFTELPNQSFVFRPSESDQRDRFIRSMLGAQYSAGKAHFNFQSSFVHHLLDYRQNSTTPLSSSAFDSFVNSLEATISAARNLELAGGLNYTLETGNADELSSPDIQRNRLSAFAAIKHSLPERLTTVLSARQEIMNSTAMPFAPSLGSEFLVSRHLKLTGSISRNYRVPTMNDLYWRGIGAEGNPGLLAEHSWSEEAGIHFNKSKGNSRALTLRITAFSNQVDNWILWQPAGTVWSPENIRKVWSRGSEVQATCKFIIGQLTSSIAVLYSFTRSTTLDVYDPFAENEIGNQLMYTPIHEGSVVLDAGWRKWKAYTIVNLTGKQFTDSDNNPSLALDGYGTVNLWVQRDVRMSSTIRSKCILEVNNILNTSYENREGYPMPGRNYRLSINFNIQKPTTI